MIAEYITKSPSETIKLGKKLASRLKAGDVALLYGELGSGKTHFIKGIAEGLGVEVTIKSPTYVYVNKYSIGGQWRGNGRVMEGSSIDPQRSDPSIDPPSSFYHYDLYRFEAGGDLSSIGFDESLEDPKVINVVEWADRISEKSFNHIAINLKGVGNKRTVIIQWFSERIVPSWMIKEFYDEWMTPEHVRKHSELVAEVAMQIARFYIKEGEIVNLDLLYPAAMLHDMHRVCDFKELDRKRFDEKVTDEKWEKWQACRRQFKGMHHADITAKILNGRGFTETAEVIRLHKSINIVDEWDSYDTIEKQILYYADKRVKHQEVVDLKERFRDGRERYGKYDTPEQRRMFDEVEKRTFELEKELIF